MKQWNTCIHMCAFLYLPIKIQTNKLSVCLISLFSVFTKVVNGIKDISFTIIFKKMLSICYVFTECKFRYAYKEKTCIFRYRKSKTGKMLPFISCCFIVNSWYIVMAYKQMFNKHVLETIQICDMFIYSNLWYKFLYS